MTSARTVPGRPATLVELDGRHVAVTHETVTVRRPGAPTQHRRLQEGELGELLDELSVPLTDDERAALDVRVKGLRPA